MRRWIVLLTMTGLLGGCGNGAKIDRIALAETRVEHKRAAGVAYEHAVEQEVPIGQVRQVAEAVQKACTALPQRGCTLLETTILAGEAADATIRMRVVPDGVNGVLRALDGRGKMVRQSTKGEDLAEPIGDAERKLGMLTTYRDRLQALAGGRGLDPDALIKLHRELAEVQSEIEKADTARAQLHRRVDTELLTVNLHEHAKAARRGNVKRALEDFGDDLLQGVAMLITFVASALPFAATGTLGYLAWRRVRARRRGRQRP
ncbi:DUF4349 domain-containing protein [uncultured Massilia sp.]|uniref:DUF4349 domain-containing protein n=1 Tax=uncultured Massilia sp. TaxID=169973 RepID=UPI00258EA823|nr:DUF4349 domain-containing protein [uncultured Massilia sp.]